MSHPPFDHALAPHYEAAARYCRALCARGARGARGLDPEDVLQDALLRALEGYGQLRDIERFKSWLFQIVTRTYRNTARMAYWRRLLPSTGEPEYERMPAVYDVAARLPDRMLVEAALAKLAVKERAALLLFEIGGFSIEEIAEIQEEHSVSAVKSRLSRARTRLRDHVERATSASYRTPRGELP